MAEGEDRTGDIVSLQDLIRLAMLDVAPTLQPSLRAMEPVQQAIVLQCVYYAHMFFVLREQAIKRRIKLEEQKKKSLSGTFEGAEERQDAYLKRREAMVAQFGLDNAGEAETQQVAQADALITELEETLAKKGADVRLGIIGGGRIGTALLRMLLHCGTFSPDRIRVSTRRPEMLLDYQAQGVKCDYDNAMVVARSEVIFLCCLPAHLPRVAQDIAAGGGLRPQLLVVSAIAGTTAEKIQNMLKISCVLRPIVNTPIITMQIEAAFQGQYGVSDPADMARWDAKDTGAMVELATAEMTKEKQSIYTILFALQRWCEQGFELPVRDARQVALFCIVGDPKKGEQPLESFRKRFLWTLRNLPELRGKSAEVAHEFGDAAESPVRADGATAQASKGGTASPTK